MSWFGDTQRVMDHLSAVGADKDADGKYLIGGAPVTVGLGGLEVIVPPQTFYRKDGKQVPLAEKLAGGIRVMVIGVDTSVGSDETV